jgi:hypothetical protein
MDYSEAEREGIKGTKINVIPAWPESFFGFCIISNKGLPRMDSRQAGMTRILSSQEGMKIGDFRHARG